MRITLAAVLVTAVAVGTAGWLLVRSVEDTQLGELRGDINANLDEVVARLEDGADAQDAVDNSSPAGFGLLQVTDEHDEVVASSVVQGGRAFVLELSDHGPPAAGTEVAGHPQTDVANGGATIPPPDGADGSGALIGANGVVASSLERIARTVDTPSGRLTVTAAAPVDQVARSVDALRERLWIGLPALIALVAAVAWVLVGRALRPVDAMRAEVDEITGSTMHRRVPEPATGDEIGRLARTMNAMLGRLDASATQQRRFVSDASHELRSPVAAIRTSLEVARRRPDRADWPSVADTALAEEARLEALLDDLLLLAAHDENGSDPIRPRPVDLTALAATEALRPRRVPVEVVRWPADGEPLEIAALEDQLAHAVSNLVDNAARYATSAVRITLSCFDDTVRILVDDDGPGIAPADRDRVFERFTRLDDSRARAQGGSGLGLAVVRAIVARHHGEIRIEDSPLGGARFVVELPAWPPAPG
ncbi:MAG TPA: HAMP domain-containing sensor histidine kinase [Acidimicrobiales bacterium]|nr:HAMP domain-containing sensor histidine kinase [Acidimicrobiales bacterium]